jgi:hypothetical protein
MEAGAFQPLSSAVCFCSCIVLLWRLLLPHLLLHCVEHPRRDQGLDLQRQRVMPVGGPGKGVAFGVEEAGELAHGTSIRSSLLVLWLQASLPSMSSFLFSPQVSFSSLFLSASPPSSPVSTSNEGCRAQVYPCVKCSHLTQAHARPLSAKFLGEISNQVPLKVSSTAM